MSTVNPPVSTVGTGSGLGYGIAITVSILVLISTIMLASYACIRVKGGGSGRNGGNSSGHGSGGRIGNYGTNGHFSAGDSAVSTAMMVGLDCPIIDSYPKIVLGESRRLPKPNDGPCSICLSDYLSKDTIRLIPDCHHCFHADCIDEWLKMSATCRLSRNSPTPSKGPTPVTTPLAEVVPLTFTLGDFVMKNLLFQNFQS